MFCEIILDSIKNKMFRENHKSADRIAKFEYVVKVVTYSKSPDHRLKSHVQYVNILLSLKFF